MGSGGASTHARARTHTRTRLQVTHAGLGKEELKEVAFKENAVERWEELHPGSK